jgi:RNA polymerase sigma-70 factor (ECF subfamily)
MQTVPQVMPSQSTAAFKADLLKAIPKLRAFAVALCRDTERGDDLVQETLLKAIANAHSFAPGSNMSGWLYTILRNGCYSTYRKRRHEIEDADGRYAGLMQIPPSQEGHIHFLDVREAFDRLSTEHREALMMVVSGMSYDDASAMCGCAVGTMKSRVNRARARLTELLTDREFDAARDHIARDRPEIDVSGSHLSSI